MAYEHLTQVTEQLIGAAIEVHRALGPGLRELAYSRAIRRELSIRGIPYDTEANIPLEYKGQALGVQRMDLLVRDEIIVELKAVYKINDFHLSQMLSYLRAGKKNLGLILNFGRARLEIRRVAL